MDNNTCNSRFIGFIVGQGRSGTTLFSAMLNRHSQTCVTPETQFYQFISLYPGDLKAFIENYPESLRNVFSKMHATNKWTPDPEPIIEKHPKLTSKQDIHDLFLSLGDLISKQLNKSYWLEKTPAHIRDIPLIDELHPNQAVIHLIRDGRAVAESLCRMKWASDSFVENCLYWLWTMQFHYRFLAKRKNVLTVRYEDLVTNPSRTLNIVCRFLGIAYEPQMLEQNDADEYLIETGLQHKNKIKGAIDSDNINLWRDKISDTEAQLAERLIGHELKKWQYPITDFTFDSAHRVLVSPFVPLPETHMILEDTVCTLLKQNEKLWIDECLNIGEKLTTPPRYWLHFDEILSHRFCKNSLTNSYIYFITTTCNLIFLRLTGGKLIFYYNPDAYNNCHWKMKRFLISLCIKNAYKVVASGDDYNFIDKNYALLKETQKISV